MIYYPAKLSFFIFLSFITNILSAQNLIYPDSVPVKTIRVPVPYLQGGTIQDYITDIQYLPLEIGDKGGIISKVQEMAINRNRILLYSNSLAKNTLSSLLYAYDTEGKLKHRLSTTDDLKTGNFNEIQAWKQGFLLRTMRDAIELDTAGHWTKTPNPMGDISDSLSMNHATWYYQTSRERDTGLPKIGLYRGTTPYVRYHSNAIPMLFDDLLSPLSPYYTQFDAAYCTFSFSTEIFELSDKDIRQVYKFIFPLDYTLDPAQYRLVKSIEERKLFASKYPNTILGFDQVVRYKGYILLQLKFISGTTQWMALNLETNDFIDLQSLVPDMSSEYTSIFGQRNFLQTDGEHLYGILYPDQFIDRWGETENKRPITEKARSLSKSKNPVLVRFKLK